MNVHERRYHKTQRALVAVCVLWLATMAVPLLLPKEIRDSDATAVVLAVIVVVLFPTAFVVGAVSMVSYARWTGKYPFHFLFRGVHKRGEASDDEERRSDPRNGC